MPNDMLTAHEHKSATLRHIGPVLPAEVQRALISTALERARSLGRIKADGAVPVAVALEGVYSLARWQSSYKNQGDRGTCWAFAGASALEAAYRRAFQTVVDVSEEYVFHMGKAFALNRDATGAVAQPVENNSVLVGFQGSGDIVQKLSENAAPPEETAPYLPSQQDLLNLLPVLGYAGQAALVTQEDFDALEFCEQHVSLLARVNARYRATGWTALGANPSIEALENTILANHEVVCDVTVKPAGGHVLTLIGFDRNRRVFQAKNSWGEGNFIEIKYENDPNFVILTGYYINGVVDPTFVESEACWLGNWWVTTPAGSFRLLLRRSEDFASPGQATRLGSAYLSDGRHDVNGNFELSGLGIRLFVAPGTGPTVPGALSGTELSATLDFSDVYNASGTYAGHAMTMSRFRTRFAAVFEEDDGTPWVARHGIDAPTYQATFDDLVREGFRLTSVSGYSEGREARFNAVFQRRGGPAWEARHGLSSDEYQATFSALARRGFRLIEVSGYAEHGQARYAALWEQRSGPEWQARHGMTSRDYQATFDELVAQGYRPVHVCGYRVGVAVLFAAIWERSEVDSWVARHGLTSKAYQAEFDAQLAAGRRLRCISGYSDAGIARYAAIWESDACSIWQARHGLDSEGYQRAFDDLRIKGFRPVHVSGYGDGFYPA